jgi:hypothetical protein
MSIARGTTIHSQAPEERNCVAPSELRVLEVLTFYKHLVPTARSATSLLESVTPTLLIDTALLEVVESAGIPSQRSAR